MDLIVSQNDRDWNLKMITINNLTVIVLNDYQIKDQYEMNQHAKKTQQLSKNIQLLISFL